MQSPQVECIETEDVTSKFKPDTVVVIMKVLKMLHSRFWAEKRQIAENADCTTTTYYHKILMKIQL